MLNMPDVLIFSFYGKVKRIGILIVQKLETNTLCEKEHSKKLLLIIRYMLKLSFLEWVIK